MQSGVIRRNFWVVLAIFGIFFCLCLKKRENWVVCLTFSGFTVKLKGLLEASFPGGNCIGSVLLFRDEKLIWQTK